MEKTQLNNIIHHFETKQYQLFQQEFVDQMDDDWTIFMKFDLVNYIAQRIQSDSKSKLESKIDSKLESKIDSKLESELESKIDSKIDSELESKIDSKIDSEKHKELNSELDSKLNSKLELNLDHKKCLLYILAFCCPTRIDLKTLDL